MALNDELPSPLWGWKIRISRDFRGLRFAAPPATCRCPFGANLGGIRLATPEESGGASRLAPQGDALLLRVVLRLEPIDPNAFDDLPWSGFQFIPRDLPSAAIGIPRSEIESILARSKRESFL